MLVGMGTLMVNNMMMSAVRAVGADEVAVAADVVDPGQYLSRILFF
jgi:hypothetical protein